MKWFYGTSLFIFGFAMAIALQPYLQNTALFDLGSIKDYRLCDGGPFKIEATASYQPRMIMKCSATASAMIYIGGSGGDANFRQVTLNTGEDVGTAIDVKIPNEN